MIFFRDMSKIVKKCPVPQFIKILQNINGSGSRCNLEIQNLIGSSLYTDISCKFLRRSHLWF